MINKQNLIFILLLISAMNFIVGRAEATSRAEAQEQIRQEKKRVHVARDARLKLLRQGQGERIVIGETTYYVAKHMAAAREDQVRSSDRVERKVLMERQGSMLIFDRRVTSTSLSGNKTYEVVFDNSSGRMRILSGVMLVTLSEKHRILTLLTDHELVLVDGRAIGPHFFVKPSLSENLLRKYSDLQKDRRLEKVELDLLPPSLTVH